MSRKFLGKVASGAALGCAVLLFTSPGAALADTGKEDHGDKDHTAEEEVIFEAGIEQSEISLFNTAQNNQSVNEVIAEAAENAVAINIPIQVNAIVDFGFGFGLPLNGSFECVNGLNGEDLSSASEIESLGDAAEFLQWLDSECSDEEGYTSKNDSGHHKVPKGDVAAGDGGALTTANTSAIAVAGAGMLGMAALGGLALARRQSARGTIA